MRALLGYALAFGAGVGVTKYFPWSLTTGEQHGEKVPGSKITMKGHILDIGARLAGHFAPVNAIHEHVCGFHFYSGDINRQVPAHHYCSHINQDFRQCVIYDSDHSDARLIGIEYIISEKLFNQLSPEEKKLWHSHVYEVKGGLMSLVGVPDIAEKEAMKELINTYGKTFHTWQIDRGDPIPLGVPQLMMAFTDDGQVQADLINRRDELYNISAREKRHQRANIEAPVNTNGADAWSKSGKAVQLITNESKMKMHK